MRADDDRATTEILDEFRATVDHAAFTATPKLLDVTDARWEKPEEQPQ